MEQEKLSEQVYPGAENTEVKNPHTMPKRRGTPPLCAMCGKELTVTDSREEGLLDDGNMASRMANILSSAEHNNVMLTGEAGTGKSASVRLLGRRVAEGKVKELLGKRIFEVNLDLLFSSCYTVSDKGEKLRLLFQEAEEYGIILFIDEAHRIYGAGESNSVGNIVKPYITSGSVRLILATTNIEYETFIAQDAALARRFERIRLKEPDAKRTAEIIRSVFAARYPAMTIKDGTIKELVSLADRYVREKRYNPDKSLSVLDYAAAWQQNNGAGREITSVSVKRALAEKLGISPERFEQDLTMNIRQTAGKLKAKFPAWHDGIDSLACKLSEALTRDLRRKGPLCKAALAGSDMALLREISDEAVKAMGFSRDEIIRAVPTDSPDELVEPFLVNPNRAIIVEVKNGGQYAGTPITALLTLILREGRIKGRFGDALYGKAPVLVLFEGEEENGGAIGFGKCEQGKTAKLSPEQEVLLDSWFDEAAPVYFGGIDRKAAEALYTGYFIPLLEKRRRRLHAPRITVTDDVREYVIQQLHSARGWSRASEITEEMIRMAIVGGGIEYTAGMAKGAITLHDNEAPQLPPVERKENEPVR